MNKNELVTRIAQKVNLPKTTVLNLTDALISTIENACKKGDKVILAGFGTWQKRRRRERIGRNPQTGKPMKIPSKNVITFHSGQNFSDLIN